MKRYCIDMAPGDSVLAASGPLLAYSCRVCRSGRMGRAHTLRVPRLKGELLFDADASTKIAWDGADKNS